MLLAVNLIPFFQLWLLKLLAKCHASKTINNSKTKKIDLKVAALESLRQAGERRNCMLRSCAWRQYTAQDYVAFVLQSFLEILRLQYQFERGLVLEQLLNFISVAVLRLSELMMMLLTSSYRHPISNETRHNKKLYECRLIEASKNFELTSIAYWLF